MFFVQPYVKSTQIFKCPSNTTVSTNYVYATPNAGVSIPAIPRSYYINGGDEGTSGNGMGGKRPYKKDAGVSIASIVSTATTISVCELKGNQSDPKMDNAGYFTTATDGFQSHLGTTNFLFMDGHVKALKPTGTASLTLNMWTNDNAGAFAGMLTNLGTAEGLMQ